MHRAMGSDWPNDYKGIWHDCLGMCNAAGKDISPTDRLFTLIIRGVGNRRYWRFKASLHHVTMGAPFLFISLADEPVAERLFELGQVVITEGAASLTVDCQVQRKSGNVRRVSYINGNTRGVTTNRWLHFVPAPTPTQRSLPGGRYRN